jgi:hypothetical protein
MLAPEWIKSNPFRVLRLPSGATATEVHTAAAAMRRAAVLRAVEANAGDLPMLGAIPRTEADIRSAIGKLENPTQRLKARLFWFYSPLGFSVAPSTSDSNLNPPPPLKEAALLHDQALSSLYELTVDNSSTIPTWGETLRRWHHATHSGEHRRLSSTLENLGGFEPAALQAEIEDLQAEADLLAAEPLLMSARSALAGSDYQTVRDTLLVFDSLKDTGDWSMRAQQEIISPAISALRSACEKIHEDFSERIIRANDAAKQNVPVCKEEINRFRSEVCPRFESLIAILPADHEDLILVRQTSAKLLWEVALHCTWADQFILADELLKEALIKGQGTVATFQVERSLQKIQDQVRHERKYEGVTDEAFAALVRLQELLRTVDHNVGSTVVHKPDAAEKNYVLCMGNLHVFRTEILPALDNLSQKLPDGHVVGLEARSQTALCLDGIASGFTWADEFRIAEKLRDEALGMAQGTEAVKQIQEGLDKIRSLARREAMYEELKPISSAPSLTTINTLGFRLYGHSDYDPENKSFVATHYFVAMFLPLFPVGRYRVIQTDKGYRFLGKLPLRKFDWWHLGIGFAVITIIVIILGYSPAQRSNQASHADRSTSSAGSASDASGDQTATPIEGPISAPSVAPASDASGDRKATPIDSPTYRASSSASDNQALLASIKSQIDDGRARISDLKTELEPVVDELTDLDRRIKPLGLELKSLDEQSKAGDSIDVDDFNSKVETYNALLAQRRALYNDHVGDLQTYQELEQQDSMLVDRYNALLGVR